LGSSQRGTQIHALLVDGDPEHTQRVAEIFAAQNLQLIVEQTAEAAFERFSETHPRIVLSELNLPGMSGFDLLDKILNIDPGTDFLAMTDLYSAESAVDAIRRGACDYLVKPIDADHLRRRIHGLMEEAEIRQKSLLLDQSLLHTYQFEGMLGRSPLMLDVFAKIRRIAPHFRTVLVTGATGTGKELVANALHRLRPAGAAPFAVCNCSALVDTLLESELFGHLRGAFTGATHDKLGVFEYANGGTVFLDEVGELPLAAQAKLLRVLQNQEVQRVGSPVTRHVNIRVIAATHRNLSKMVAEGQFRQDLFYRLSAVQIELPRLRDRREDLPWLQRHFVEKYAALYKKPITGITRRAQAQLTAHNWPGNVRELENVISAGCIMAMSNVIDLHDLPDALQSVEKPLELDDDTVSTLEQVQLRHLVRVLHYVGGNKARAAEILGVGRNTIYQMLARMPGGLVEFPPPSKTSA
jgi:DNA-binding NtrC family response regulator